MEYLTHLIIIIGFIIGLGAVVVIDLHGLMARKSSYWTESTIRAHKITKPLIWVGIMLVLAGTILAGITGIISQSIFIWRLVIIAIMITNGCFLSFVISPELLKREADGRIAEVLPQVMQMKITASFIISVISWWGMVAWVVWTMV